MIATPDPNNKPLDLGHILGPEGPLAESLGEYESRPQQIEMARAVEQALSIEPHAGPQVTEQEIIGLKKKIK